MGNALSDLLDGGKSEEDEKRANDALNSLVDLATLRHEAFELKVKEGNVDTTLIPIDKILTKSKVIKCSVDLDPGKIGDEIGEILGDFISGKIADGIKSSVTHGLNLLFGNFSANRSEQTSYVISVGSNGGLYRIDTDYYAYEYTSTDLKAVCKNVVATSIIVSSVDPNKVDTSTLRDLVGLVFGSSDVKTQADILKEILDAKKEDNAANNIA